MIDLTIVIVNYNVSFFLEQCLHAVKKAQQNLNLEVFVVDNNSKDASIQTVEEKFTWVNLIKNSVNVGFSKANNQAIHQAKGKYILLLNPDTVIEENTLTTCFNYMENHADAGALGVKMIDGKGKFLPESKRSLPTPSVAFYKIFGLSNLFPKSKKFAKYHLGFLSENKNHKIEILSGAFMFMRAETLKITGALDESYFMYGEDIDLSYKILKAGYNNYYLSDTKIIHYKGESTKKGSINYVFVFYRAMIIFAKKHFSPQNAKIYSVLINLAIYFRALTAIISRIAKSLFLPLLDFLLLSVLFYFTQAEYALYANKLFPQQLVIAGSLIFPSVYIFSLFIAGGYDVPFYRKNIYRGLGLASFVLFVTYALLSEDFRFSRAVFLVSVALGFLFVLGLRLLLNLLPFKRLKLASNSKKRIGIVANEETIENIENIIKQTTKPLPTLLRVSASTKRPLQKNYAASFFQLKQAINIFKLNEVVFCSSSLNYTEIIDAMQQLNYLNLEFKIALPSSQFIIGSNSINTSGEYYSLLNYNNITNPTQKRNKRIIDLGFALLVLILSPFFILFQSSKKQMLVNAFSVFVGNKSWVGFGQTQNKQTYLPKLKTGVFSPNHISQTPVLTDKEMIEKNMEYAKKYSVLTDIKILTNNLNNLGFSN